MPEIICDVTSVFSHCHDKGCVDQASTSIIKGNHKSLAEMVLLFYGSEYNHQEPTLEMQTLIKRSVI